MWFGQFARFADRECVGSRSPPPKKFVIQFCICEAPDAWSNYFCGGKKRTMLKKEPNWNCRTRKCKHFSTKIVLNCCEVWVRCIIQMNEHYRERFMRTSPRASPTLLAAVFFLVSFGAPSLALASG